MLMTCCFLTPDQRFNLIAAMLSGSLAVAAILFGVLGFVYSIFAMVASQEKPPQIVGERPELTTVVSPPAPIQKYLRQVAGWIVVGLGASFLIVGGCVVWFLVPADYYLKDTLCVSLVYTLLLEVLGLFVLGCYVIFSRMMHVGE
jgi:hypothetical protein